MFAMSDPDCPFCRIIAGTAQADILYRDERLIAFKDARPIAPVHILIVPNEHIISTNEVTDAQEAVLGHMTVIARQLASDQQVEQSGYRLVINTGPNAGQSVYHLHMHLIGGRHLPFRFE